MEQRMDIIGDEIVVEGQVVGVLKPGLGASLRSHLERTVRGLTLDDYENEGGGALIETLRQEDEDYRARVTDFVKFVRGLLKRGRDGRRELAAKANARVNELKRQLAEAQGSLVVDGIAQPQAYNALKAQLQEYEAWIGQWQCANQALQDQLATALRERDEARAWAESAVKEAYGQGIEVGRQQVSFQCGGR